MTVLTKDQQVAYDKMMSFAKSPTSDIFVLKGSAGVGKTFLLSHFIKQLDPKTVALTSPTNKATKVLRQMMRNDGGTAHCSTIHSLMGLVPTYNGSFRELRQKGRNKLHNFRTVVIDEGSMINLELNDFLMANRMTGYPKVIFCGDPYQLPPVNEDYSVVFDYENQYEIMEIVRQSNTNPIIFEAERIKKFLRKETEEIDDLVEVLDDLGQGISLVEGMTDYKKLLKEQFTSMEFTKDDNHIRSVAWTNNQVNKINTFVRTKIYGKTETPFIVNEKVLVQDAIVDESNPENTEVLFHTDEECVVREINRGKYINKEVGDVNTWNMYLQSEEKINWVRILDTTDRKNVARYEIILDNYLRRAKKHKNPHAWATYYQFKNSFHLIRPIYCTTVHKSQGSTYDNIIIDLVDMQKNFKFEEFLKLLYVAITRAKRRAYVRIS